MFSLLQPPRLLPHPSRLLLFMMLGNRTKFPLPNRKAPCVELQSEKLCFVPYYSRLLWLQKHERATFASFFIRHITNYTELWNFSVNPTLTLEKFLAYFHNYSTMCNPTRLSIDSVATFCIDAWSTTCLEVYFFKDNCWYSMWLVDF